jgi:8-oxo-dGTP pyrophosphatase MutT (NUDIX family)
MTPAVVAKMPWTRDFVVNHEAPRSVHVVDSSGGTDTANAINRAFSELVSLCIERDLFHVLCRRHSEPCAIPGAPFATPVHVERFAAALFGLVSRGVHLVAYTTTTITAAGTDTPARVISKVWVSRRSAHLYTHPGTLDVTVGGGIQAGASPLQTVVDEADEEASLPAALVRQRARPRGVVSHMGVTGPHFRGEKGLVVPDYIYVYDMELPDGGGGDGDGVPVVVPRPHDDEVEGFLCLSIAELQGALRRGEFKTDSAAVLVYFMIVHGIITAENEPDYVEINMRLHRRLPFKTG